MTLVWTLPERMLVAELCVGIARRLNEILGQSEQGYVWHQATSDFEHGCSLLWRMGVAVGEFDGQADVRYQSQGLPAHLEPIPAHYKFSAPAEIRDVVITGRLPIEPPSVLEVLKCYVSVACDYGGGPILSAHRKPFFPPDIYALEIQALKRSGYVNRLGSAVVWTDAMAPAMEHCWGDSGQSLAETAEIAMTADAQTALRQTPEHTARVLANAVSDMSELDFAELLLNRFDGLFWTKNPDGSLRASQGDVSLLKAVYRELRKAAR